MNSAFDQDWMEEQQQLPRLRQELVAYPQVYDGQPFWVYKDPLSLRYYRFNREEHFIIEQLRKGTTLEELRIAHQQQFKSSHLSNQEIGQFISTLMSQNLLVMNLAHRDELLYKSAHKRSWAKIKGQVSNFMFLKIPLCDPDRFFNRVIPHIRFIWTWPFFAFYLLALALASILIINRWSEFTAMFHTSFFTIYNMPLVFLAFWLVKALHELGHGFTCKNYGGEVHEMGFLFLVFAPFLYCNITDSWTFPEKAKRLLTTAGGIMTELLIAAFATVIWYYTDRPGFVHAFAFNIIVVCSISTILFNANPLLKYDGYYILMDLIEVPNLRQRSSKFITNLLVRYLLGGRFSEMPEEHRFRYVFPFYSVSALIYRWFIIFVIIFSVYRLLEHMKLVWLGRFFATFAVLTMLIIPVGKTVSMLTKQRQELGISHTRILLIMVLLVVFVSVALFWPLQQHVTLNFILEPVKMQWLRTNVAGHLEWADNIHEGVWLPADNTIIARLDNPELQTEAVKNAAQIAEIKISISQWQKQGLENQVQQLQERLQVLLNEQKRLEKQLADLEVKTPFRGCILSQDESLNLLRGKYVQRAQPLLLLADTRTLVARVWVNEKNYARIFKRHDQVGQSSELMLYAFSKDKFRGEITAVSLHREDNMGEFNEKLALSNKVGGEVLTEYDPLTKTEKPMEVVYEVTIDLDRKSLPKMAASFRPYMSGRARIDCGKYTLYQWGRDTLLRFISPEIRL